MTPDTYALRVLVAGGRNYSNAARIDEVLSRFSISELAQGGASGADALACKWAADRLIPVRTFNADWPQYGKAAGMIRNEEMLLAFKPDLVLIFPGGNGTANMYKTALKHGYLVGSSIILVPL